MELAFRSQYCRLHCYPYDCPPHVTLFAPTIPDPPRRDIPPPPSSPSRSSAYQSPSVEDAPDEGDAPRESRQRTTYRSPTVEDVEEPAFQQEGNTELKIDLALTYGSDHYRTYRPNTPTAPENRARMTPNQPMSRPRPILKVAGRRRALPPPPKPPMPPLSVPLPLPPETAPSQWPSERPDTSDIRMVRATNFLQFCRAPGVEAIRLTW